MESGLHFRRFSRHIVMMFDPLPPCTLENLRHAGLRPTRQRLALASLMFGSGMRHLTAEQLQLEARAAQIKVSLATIYNTLHQFTEAGLLREVVVAPGRSYFDTNIDEHHHFYYERDGALMDIPVDHVKLAEMPAPPEGTAIARIDVIIRVESRPPRTEGAAASED